MIYIFSKNSTERKQMAKSTTASPSKRKVIIGFILDFSPEASGQILDCFGAIKRLNS
ncbi:hypothetical protein FLCH110379_13105 [Flavobacterium chungbukense]|uniref:Uncharacterized protein n=1 Tax=Flavobacterium chungbukense TaxID=877464 RepID=A0ABP7Y8Q8_9FLAO